ncbi:MAG: class I SAM-dependent RNA methyltransferase [Defluviitaleaceae bacterium]|nr:class I SAM-dependent RNA methyltransferase [Defluviitaleaceae bacterium]
MQNELNLTATCAFGLEASLKREMISLGLNITSSGDGRVEFCGGFDAIARANLWLRCADRILLKIAEFPAKTFDELFDGVFAISWQDFIPRDSKIIVLGKSVKSKLSSVPSCQSITKKAIVEKLKLKYGIAEHLPETGFEYRIQAALLKDVVTVTIDTTGAALHKRGYRQIASAAPIKETLAAAMIELSYWRKNRILLDPFCGSGTIAIEAALIAKNIAPGLMRNFASENWQFIGREVWATARKNAYLAMDTEYNPKIFASDINPQLIELARENARIAGIDDCIEFAVADIADIKLPGDYGVIITNPPYGERLSDGDAVQTLHTHLGRILPKDTTWSTYVITNDPTFETAFGRRANAKRKLFNGNIKTDYYQFHGPKPVV